MTDNQEWVEEKEIERAETKKETDKKCPACGGTMDFDPNTGGLLCPYCGHKMEIKPVEEGKTAAKEQDFESADLTENCNWGVEKKTVSCKSCGGESVYDALQVSDTCPYCGSNQVMEAQGTNTIAPGGVCVFKVTSETAGANFKGWLKKKWFCPKEAKLSANPKSFQGVYLPYWTFDAQTESEYKGEYGIDHQVRNAKGESHTETDWHKTSGSYSFFVDDQPVVATTRHDAAMLKQLEPFNTADNLIYKPEYVAGFISERYSVGLKDAWTKAKEFIKTKLIDNISGKIKREKGASGVRRMEVNTEYSEIAYKYLLLPIWISSFKYKDKVYQFMVNGQTGKVAGKTPISALRVAIAVVIVLAILALLIYIS